MSPLSALIPSLQTKHFLVFTVSFIAVLSEVLPITLANTPYSPATIQEVYYICPLIAIGILALMLITLSILVLRHDHGLKHLPRKPTTIASVLLYLTTQPYHYDGGMLHSLAGLELMSGSEMRKMVIGMGRLYGMGWVSEKDFRIDEEDRIQRLL